MWETVGKDGRGFSFPLKYLRRGWIRSFPLNNIWKEKRRVEHHQLLEPVDSCQLLRQQRERKPKQFSELSTSSGVCLFGIPNNIPLNFIIESASLLRWGFNVAHLVHTLKRVRTYYFMNRNNNLSQYFTNPSAFLSLQIKVITLSGFAITGKAANTHLSAGFTASLRQDVCNKTGEMIKTEMLCG